MYSSNVVIRGDGHMVEFSQRLKQLRKDKHLTQAQVAKRIGVTASMVSSYETDIRLPSYEVMVRIADVFGVTVDYLLLRPPGRGGTGGLAAAGVRPAHSPGGRPRPGGPPAPARNRTGGC